MQEQIKGFTVCREGGEGRKKECEIHEDSKKTDGGNGICAI